LSFLTLGIFWVGQQTQLSSFTRSTRALSWIHLMFLLAVTLLPFSTGLLAQDTTYRLAVAVYWLNLLALGTVLLISIRYADRAGLLSADTTEEMRAALERRIVVYQGLYALAVLTCLINTYLAIGLNHRPAAQRGDRAADLDSRPGLSSGRRPGRRPCASPARGEGRPLRCAATSALCTRGSSYQSNRGSVATAIAGWCHTTSLRCALSSCTHSPGLMASI
jgi:hypothetical protein